MAVSDCSDSCRVRDRTKHISCRRLEPAESSCKRPALYDARSCRTLTIAVNMWEERFGEKRLGRFRYVRDAKACVIVRRKPPMGAAERRSLTWANDGRKGKRRRGNWKSRSLVYFCLYSDFCATARKYTQREAKSARRTALRRHSSITVHALLGAY